MSKIAKEHLYSMLTGVTTHHDEVLNGYGTQIMNEVLGILDTYFEFENDENNTDKLSVEKLQEQFDIAKEALTEIAEIINTKVHECDYGCDNFCELNGSLNVYSVENVQSITESALAAIGGDDE